MQHKLFPSQQPGEKILIVVREHWFLLASKIAIIVILLVAPSIIKAVLGSSVIPAEGTPAYLVINLIGRFYYLALLIALFIVWVLYYLNIHIVSEDRIVDMDQVGLLKHVASELNIETIEDVSSETTGLFGNLLNYGTVLIQTAGAEERFHFENVPHPEKIASVILELYEAHPTREKPRP